MAPRRDFTKAMMVTLIIVVAVLLTLRFGFAGLAASAVIAGAALVLARNNDSDPELASLRTSLAIARDDVTDVIDAYDQLLNGTSTEAIADRTLHYPALATPGSTEPAIEEFQLRVASARRFVARIDAHLADHSLDRVSLERLINVTDERAAELALSWADARRAARRLGP